MGGVREAKKAQTLRSIMDAAIKLFSKKGFEKTSVDELARAAGVGKGTIYGYFKTKSEIFLAFCEEELDYAFADLAKKRDPDAPLIDQLHTLFMGQFRYVTKDRDFGRILAREMIFPKELTHEKVKKLEEPLSRPLPTGRSFKGPKPAKKNRRNFWARNKHGPLGDEN